MINLNKKVSVAGFFLLFVFAPLSFSEKSDWNLSVEPIFGMKNGTVGEYVFLKKSNYSDDMVSELIYDMKPELYGGAKIRGGWRGIFAEASVSGGFPMKTGTVSDSDWFNNAPEKVSAATALLTTNHKTDYSESDCKLEYDFSCGIKLGYDFSILNNDIIKIHLKPFYSFDYNTFKFIAQNGKFWYGKKLSEGYYASYTDTENRTSGTFASITANYDGDDLSYKRWGVTHWIGFDVSADLPLNFAVSTGFQVAPYVYAESTDIHYLTNTAYLDITDGFFSVFKWNCGVSYKISKRNSVGISASWFYMRTLRGDDYVKLYSTYKKDDEKFDSSEKSKIADAGANQFYFDLSLSWKFSIF